MAAIFIIALLHLCFSAGERPPLPDIICGDIGQFTRASAWLTRENIISVYSNGIYEFLEDRKADKLVDGDSKTMAQPGGQGNELDYIIELADVYRIKKAVIDWGDFGLSSSTGHIGWWSLQARLPGEEWRTVAQGKTPEKSLLILDTNFTAKDLRLEAGHEEVWIGVFELKLLGRPRH